MLGVATIHGRYDHSAWRKSTAFRGGEEVGNYGFRGANPHFEMHRLGGQAGHHADDAPGSARRAAGPPLN